MISNISKKIFFKIFSALFLVAIVPLSVSVFVNHGSLIEKLSVQIGEELNARTEEMTIYTDSWMEMNLRMLRQNAALEEIVSMSPERQIPILKSIAKEYGKWLSEIYTVTLDGKNVARADNGVLQDFTNQAWFQHALKASFVADLEYDKNDKHATTTLAVPIINREGKLVGILGAVCSLADLSNAILKIKPGETGYTYILSEKGQLIAHPRKDNFNAIRQLQDLSSNQDGSDKLIFIDQETNKRVIAVSQKTQHGWIAVAQQNYDEAFSFIIQSWRIALFILIGFLFVSFLTALTLALFYNALKKNDKTGFRFIIYLSFAMCINGLTPFIINEYFNYQLAVKQLARKVDQRLSNRSDALVSYINVWMDMNLKALRQNALQDALISMDSKRQTPVIKAVDNEYKWIFLVHTVGLNGKNVARSDSEKRQSFNDQMWFKQVANGSSFSYQVETTANPTLALAIPILNDKNRIVGVLGAMALLSDLSNFVTTMRIGKTGDAYVLTAEGKLVVHQKKLFTETSVDFGKFPPFMALKQESKKKVLFNDKISKKDTISYSQKTKHGWVVVVQQEHEEGEVIILKEMKYKFLKLFLSTLLFIAISFFISLRVILDK